MDAERVRYMFRHTGKRIYSWLEQGMKHHPVRTGLIWLFGGGLAICVPVLALMLFLSAVIPPGEPEKPERIAIKGYIHDEHNVFLSDEETEKMISFLQAFEKQTGVRVVVAMRRYNERDWTPSLVPAFARKIDFGDHPPKRWVLAHYQVAWDYIFMGLGGDKMLVSKLDKKAVERVTYNCRGSNSRCSVQKGAEHTVRLLVEELRLVLTGNRNDPTEPVAN
ncbi:MAG: TPM domain-containing protein, partial [Beijerinckiaceae bacterium]|nr:TPM domain-containing protein [Beijerinckiaceae bacterium]